MSIDIASKLFPNITTIIIQLLSTGVLFLLFKKFLWVPVQAYFTKRADFIETQMNEATLANEKAKLLMMDSEKQARLSASEYRDIVERAKNDALKLHDQIIVDAKKEATSKIEQAQKEIEADKQQAKEEMREEMVNIAIEVASKVIHKEMNTKENQQMVEEFVEKVVN
ncbi:MAG: F0F1 ATP synthase subunit B [Coprobacillus sp.]